MSGPCRRFQPNTACIVLLVAWSLLPQTASATPSITLSEKSGPPTDKVLVSGTGFSRGVIVDIYFGEDFRNQCATNSKGEFSNIPIRVPKEALPGDHSVIATARHGKEAAKRPFLVRTNWRQFHFDADGRRVNPYENVLNPKTVGRLALKWSYALDTNGDSSPDVADGVVYIAGSGLNALNANTGALLWTFSAGYSLTEMAPAVSDGLVYAGACCGGIGGTIYAVDARTGTQRWNNGVNSNVEDSPTVLNGVVYIGSDDGTVFALDARTGAKIWSNVIAAVVRASPLVADGVVYFGTNGNDGGGPLYALNSSTGDVIWSYPASGVRSSPALVDGIIYFGSFELGTVIALRASDGSVLWSTPIGTDVGSSPAVEKGVVYIGSDRGDVYALDAHTGAKLWTYETGGSITSSPAVANGVVYIGSQDQKAYALDAKNGTLLWSATVGTIYSSSPTVANGVLYVAAPGMMYAFGLPDGAHGKRSAASRPIRP